MNEVRYADPGSETALEASYEYEYEFESDLGSSSGEHRSGDGSVTAMFHRAVGEQLAEQRLIHEALIDFDRRLESAERGLVDRLATLERSLAERMGAYEDVLRRVVDRLSSGEERLAKAVEHSDTLARLEFDGLRQTMATTTDTLTGALERSEESTRESLDRVEQRWNARIDELESHLSAAIDRAVERVSHTEEVVRARLEALEPVVESAVLGSVAPELGRALDTMRAALADTGRKITRDVNRLGYLLRRDGAPIPGFEPVDAAASADRGANGAGRRPRRARPLRARPSAEDD